MRAESLCMWCGKPLVAHAEHRPPGEPVPRMPCLGLQAFFLEDSRPDQRQVERHLRKHPDETLAREVFALRRDLVRLREAYSPLYERLEAQDQTRVLLRELCDAAQAVLDGKAREVDSAGDRYVLDVSLQELEAVLMRARAETKNKQSGGTL